MRRFAAPLVALAFAACRQARQPAAAPLAADSVVMQRSYCLIGFCPEYRVSVARTGVVRFQPFNFGDTARVVTETVPAASFAALVRDAERAGFAGLPERIGDSPLCGRLEPDWPTVNVTVFGAAGQKRVMDALGCRGAPPSLRRLEARIDSVAGVARWLPARH